MRDRRRPNNNDRNTKGGRGPRHARDGKRTYDRRSGTGRGREVKKSGGGARNWGSDAQDAKNAEGHVNEQDLKKQGAEDAEQDGKAIAAEEEREQEAPPAVVVEEEEDHTMTVEEYLASKSNQAAAGDGLFGAKKEKEMGDGDDDAFFKGKEAHSISLDENFVVMGTGKAVRKKKEKKQAQTLDLNFRVASGNNSGGGGRGNRRSDDKGRGGGRGSGGRDRRGGRGSGGRRGGRGGGRGGFALDSNAFPSL